MVKKVIKQMKVVEEQWKKQEVEKVVMLVDIVVKQDNGNGEKYYWNNVKMCQQGFEEFRKIWGQCINEDNWW